jgi:HAD superfamily hydrolase (TIGR01549 family)
MSGDVERSLQAAELRAAESSELTHGARDFLEACRATGRPVAMVSNNFAPAIRAFLQREHLGGYVQHIEGRDPTDPRLMKPATHLIERAVQALGADSAKTVMVGDSLTDIEAAHGFGIPVIAYANKPRKIAAFTDADAIITTMTTLGTRTATTSR